MRYLVMATTLVLVGCTGNTPVTAPASKSDIAVVEVALTAAVKLANNCLNMTTGPCKTNAVLRASMIADIHKADAAFLRVQSDNNAGKLVTLTALNAVLAQITSETPVVAK